MEDKLGEQTSDFLAVLNTEAPVSLLLNAEKMPSGHFSDSESLPWCASGLYLGKRPDFTFDPLFHAGCYYVMEPSSMFLHHVLSQLTAEAKPLRVLDLCAAPGGKSVVALSSLPSGSLLVSNEVNGPRFQTLRYNLDKWGSPNVIRTSIDPSKIPWTGLFDLVLVDAPCSGEGLFRKDIEARAHWSPSNVAHCSSRQKRILAEAERLLAPGGTIVYSTCTYSDEENIDQVRWMSQEFNCVSRDVPLPEEWHIDRVTSGDAIGFQFYPHRLRGEGLFCAVLEKQGDQSHDSVGSVFNKNKGALQSPLHSHPISAWIDRDAEHCTFFEGLNGFSVLKTSTESLPLPLWSAVHPGTLIGGGAGASFAPDHALALSTILNPEIPSVALDDAQAIAYLRKEQVNAEADSVGWHVARYKGFALGWLKQTQAGLKNYLPTKYRIIKQQAK
jgi:16S rRNA C967 or C1407 C5-methylase (RsmB/RsmF family)/NOL1/NOP2/fmu family ribosome biogenesis protein